MARAGSRWTWSSPRPCSHRRVGAGHRARLQAALRTRVVVMSGTGSLDGAVDALARGRLRLRRQTRRRRRAPGHGRPRARNSPPSTPVSVPMRDEGAAMLGRSPGMLQLYKQMSQAARGSAPVADPGRERHRQGTRRTGGHAQGRGPIGRSSRSIVPAMTQLRLESALFGHVRGALPTALGERVGLLVAARARNSSARQRHRDVRGRCRRRLLRVLQEREVRPMGAQDRCGVEARIIGDRQWRGMTDIAARRFRQDLFFRLAVFLIRVPATAQSSSGHSAARRAFLPRRKLARRPDRDHLERCHRAPASAGLARQCPGAGKRGRTTRRLLTSPRHRGGRHRPRRQRSVPSGAHPFADMPTLDELERRYLVYALQRFAGNRTRTAAALGIDRRTLYRMSARLGVPITGAEIHGDNAGLARPRRRAAGPVSARSRCVRLAATRRSHVLARPIVAVASPIHCRHRRQPVCRGPVGRQPAHGRPRVVLRPPGTGRRSVRHRSPGRQGRLRSRRVLLAVLPVGTAYAKQVRSCWTRSA